MNRDQNFSFPNSRTFTDRVREVESKLNGNGVRGIKGNKTASQIEW